MLNMFKLFHAAEIDVCDYCVCHFCSLEVRPGEGRPGEIVPMLIRITEICAAVVCPAEVRL